jgi:ureidoglycolate hydrolase
MWECKEREVSRAIWKLSMVTRKEQSHLGTINYPGCGNEDEEHVTEEWIKYVQCLDVDYVSGLKCG